MLLRRSIRLTQKTAREPPRQRSLGTLFLVLVYDVARRPGPALRRLGQPCRQRALVLPASVMNSAVPIAIGSPASGNLTGGEPMSTRSSRARTAV